MTPISLMESDSTPVNPIIFFWEKPDDLLHRAVEVILDAVVFGNHSTSDRHTPPVLYDKCDLNAPPILGLVLFGAKSAFESFPRNKTYRLPCPLEFAKELHWEIAVTNFHDRGVPHSAQERQTTENISAPVGQELRQVAIGIGWGCSLLVQVYDPPDKMERPVVRCG